MATKEQIFTILSGASAPMGRADLEEAVGESYRRFQTQLDRWVKQELLEDTGEHHYVLTDKGRAEALQEEVGNTGEDEGTGEHVVKKRETQRTVGTTEFQQFVNLGKDIGVIPIQLIQVTTNHVWNGGDYQDLKWVAQALQEMGIQRDLANRWFNAWRSHLKMPLPAGLPHDFLPPDMRKVDDKTEAERKEGAGKRDYILNEDDKPVYVGEYNGDLDYKDALDLSKIRAVRNRNDGHPTSAGSMADEVSKIFLAFKEIMGEKAVGKSYIIKPGEEGYQVEEIDPAKPMLIPSTPVAKAGSSFYIDSDGKTQELLPGQPVVIMKEAPRPASSGTQYIIDQKSGEVKEIAAGQPIVIRTESPPVAQTTPILMKDKDGNDMIFDINTFIRLEEHRDKQKRDEESHQTKLEIAKGFKELLNNAQRALTHMGEEGE